MQLIKQNKKNRNKIKRKRKHYLTPVVVLENKKSEFVSNSASGSDVLVQLYVYFWCLKFLPSERV